MRNVVLAGAACLLVSWPAFADPLPPAQDAISQPVPDAMPNNVSYGTPIGLADANKLVASAIAGARKHDWRLACAVVEPTGALVSYQKMDDTQYASAEIAIAKARASAEYRRSLKAFADAIKAGNNVVLSLPGVIAVEGAMPIVKGGKIIGALGCSGAASNQDATVVYEALEEFK